MTCDTAQALISAAFDGESAADAADHVAHCPRCAAFAATAQEVRRQIRFEPVEQPVDVVASVTDTITQTGRRSLPARWGLVAACFAIGAVLSATAVWLSDRPAPTAQAAEIEQQVQEAQATVDALDATLTVVERGWHPTVPERRFIGSLRYRAPSRFGWFSRTPRTTRRRSGTPAHWRWWWTTTLPGNGDPSGVRSRVNPTAGQPYRFPR